jgi:hypothetical protein
VYQFAARYGPYLGRVFSESFVAGVLTAVEGALKRVPD